MWVPKLGTYSKTTTDGTRRARSAVVGSVTGVGDSLLDDLGMNANLVTTDPAIWHTSGDLGMSRLFSRFLAFEIKADLEGAPFEPYAETP